MQVAASPCWQWVLPDVYLCDSFPTCLVPYPGSPRGALARFFPRGFGLPCVMNRSAVSVYPMKRLQHGGSLSGLQTFLYVQARGFACHSNRSHLRTDDAVPGSRGVYFRAEHDLLPPRASDMLAVRTEQLTAGDLHPTRVAACRLLPERQGSGVLLRPPQVIAARLLRFRASSYTEPQALPPLRLLRPRPSETNLPTQPEESQRADAPRNDDTTRRRRRLVLDVSV